MSRSMLSLDLADARRLIAAGEKKLSSWASPTTLQWSMPEAVLSPMCGWITRGLVASTLPSTRHGLARAFDAATDDLAKLTQSGQQGFGLNTTNNSRVVIFGGGIPVKIDGVVIGAVGASGGSVEQDIMVARAAVTGFVDEP